MPYTATKSGPKPAIEPTPAPRRLLELAGRFAARNDGGVAIVFGLSLIPLLLLAGAAIDYSRASHVRTHLAAVADSAALSAVTRAAMALTAAEAQAQALDLFKTQAAASKLAFSIEPDISVTDTNGQRTASVSFKAVVRATFMQIGGFETMPIGGAVTAKSSLPLHIDFHLLLDNTPSMGVGATPADVAKMVSNTPDKCAFACHDISAGGKDYYGLAKKLMVTMRIDVVRQATQKLMDTAAATAVVPGQFRASVYTFGTSCASLGVKTVSALTSNLSTVKSDASRIDLMTIPYQNYNNDQCTDFDGTFAAINKSIASPGDGSSADSPQKVLFFVSDGVADAHYPSTCSKPTTGGRCQEPIKVADCEVLKKRGVKIAVLYTTYLPLPTNGWYNKWIKPFETQIGPRMEACASPELYFEVSPSQGIAEAMEALFKKALSQARLAR